MKALVYTAPRSLEVQELAEPEPGADEVVVRVAACGICGSDLHGFLGKSRIRVPPAVMGHEFTGRVAALGGSVRDPTVGQRVVVQPVVGCGCCSWCLSGHPNICPQRRLVGGHWPGAFAECVKVPVRSVYSLPDSLSDTAGALVEPLGNAVHMLGLGGLEVHRDIVVLGCGTLGLLTAGLARVAGARQVIVTDTEAHRLEVARRLGADLALDARDPGTADRIREVTGGGAGLVVEAVGISATRRQAVEVAAPGGTVVLLGISEPESELPILDVVNREIALRGSYSCTDEEFRRAIALLADGAVDTSFWVETTSLERGQEYFERLLAGPGDLVKVLFQVS